MSFFKVTCPWCGQEFTTGVVGTTPVGSGHKCKAVKFCEYEGCEERANFVTEDDSFFCAEHRPDDVITLVQL